MSIPVMIVPVLNRPDLLYAMLASIDHPIEKVIIIDNGDVVDIHGDWTPTLRGVQPIHIISPGHNLGVGASWNLGVKASPLADWWLIANSDLEWGAGDLARIEAQIEPRAAILYKSLGLAAFVLTPPTLAAVGWFDENIHPAYNEDLDYARRCELAGVRSVEVGFTGSHVGSATIHSDPVLRWRNGQTHAANDAYYAEKWGGAKQGGETFDTPFGKGGHVGDWRLDIERLRRQAWERR